MSGNKHGEYEDRGNDTQDHSAKKVQKNMDRKHKSRRRHDEKKHLRDIVDDLNFGSGGSKRKVNDYDNYDNEDGN